MTTEARPAASGYHRREARVENLMMKLTAIFFGRVSTVVRAGAIGSEVFNWDAGGVPAALPSSETPLTGTAPY